ncbi:MAG: response regulator, partial [Gemmiger sp.]|nr:response regulator [Gemmiger sp.]
TRDILDRISELSGIQFAYEALPATNVTYDYLREHHIYLLSNVEYNETNRAITTMHLSAPYLNSEKVLVTSTDLAFDTNTPLRVALATGSGTLAKVITNAYPKFTIETYATTAECFDAVKEGKADATIHNRYVADCTLENPLYSELTVLPIQLLSDELCIASTEIDDSPLCSQLNDGLFVSVIDKSIQQLSNDELNNIIIKNTSNAHYRLSLMDLVRKYAAVLLLILLLVVLIISFLAYAQWATTAKNKALSVKNAQLAEAVSQADRANTAKSQFLSRMSHEIRTPMNAIVGLTAIARQHINAPQQVEDYLTKIDTSSKVLLNIINDVLDMSAIESNKLKINCSQFDIKQVLSSITTLYYPQCESKGVTFTLIADLENEILLGDSLRVSQILLNLVSNAYKFTERGGTIQITVKETARRDNTAFLRFTIADTGCGMNAEMQQRLFKPFEQETAGTAQKHGGSGLGLSIAKNLVDLMHGAISVSSEKSKGTTFTVELPFTIPEQPTLPGATGLKDLRVLVVDDDISAREYTSLVLRRMGVKYDSTDNGNTALQMLQDAAAAGQPYRICLLDWKMPDMDGIELTRRIRMQSGNETLIILISAYDLNEVEPEAHAAGANHFVAKPLFQSTLFNVLMDLTHGEPKPVATAPDRYDFTGHRVLLAEDNEINAEIATDLLEMVNLAVTRVENGEKAVAAFAESQPGYYDAILMDVQMPVMDGYEATRALRALPRPDAKAIPIFAMTANAFTEDVSAALSAGMNGHIAKPIDTAILYRTLADAIHG